MAVIWHDRPMVERVTFDGQRQRAALEHFQEATEMDATAVARAVGLSYPQYNRYRWGRLPLRTDQIPVFAAAYGVTTAELTQALGLMDDAPPAEADDPAWDFLAELERVWSDELGDIEPTYRSLVHADQATQRSVVAAVIDAVQAFARLDAEGDQPGQPRAVAEERAEFRVGRAG